MASAHTEAMVTRALTSWGVSAAAIGAEFGVTGQAISNIRRGLRHKGIRPDLLRWRTCHECVHWGPGCGLGFPEPAEACDLWQVGSECSAFTRFRLTRFRA